MQSPLIHPDDQNGSTSPGIDLDDLPPYDTHSDLFGLLRDLYDGFHQVILTVFVLLLDFVPKNTFRRHISPKKNTSSVEPRP